VLPQHYHTGVLIWPDSVDVVDVFLHRRREDHEVDPKVACVENATIFGTMQFQPDEFVKDMPDICLICPVLGLDA